MNFADAFKSAFNRAFDYESRSSRSEYWWFELAYVLITIPIALIGTALGLEEIPVYIAEIIFLIPALALGARRLHDIGMSGWWQLLAFTVIGLIPLIIWFCTAGHAGQNQYGYNPLEEPYSPSHPSGSEKIFKTKSVHEDEYKTSSRSNVSRPASKGASSDELLKQGFKVVKKAKDE